MSEKIREAIVRRRTVFALTPAEIAVLTELCRDGADGFVIAKRLGILETTVRSHFVNIFEKLECRSRPSAMIAALRDPELRAQCFPWLVVEATSQAAMLRLVANRLHVLIENEVANLREE